MAPAVVAAHRPALRHRRGDHAPADHPDGRDHPGPERRPHLLLLRARENGGAPLLPQQFRRRAGDARLRLLPCPPPRPRLHAPGRGGGQPGGRRRRAGHPARLGAPDGALAGRRGGGRGCAPPVSASPRRDRPRRALRLGSGGDAVRAGLDPAALARVGLLDVLVLGGPGHVHLRHHDRRLHRLAAPAARERRVPRARPVRGLRRAPPHPLHPVLRAAPVPVHAPLGPALEEPRLLSALRGAEAARLVSRDPAADRLPRHDPPARGHRGAPRAGAARAGRRRRLRRQHGGEHRGGSRNGARPHPRPRPEDDDGARHRGQPGARHPHRSCGPRSVRRAKNRLLPSPRRGVRRLSGARAGLEQRPLHPAGVQAGGHPRVPLPERDRGGTGRTRPWP